MGKKSGNRYEVIPDPEGAYVAVELSGGIWTDVDIDDWFGDVGRHVWYAAQDPSKKVIYARTHCDRNAFGVTSINMNRMILGLKDRRFKADHIDRNGLNNRRKNLRIANDSLSVCNRSLFRNSGSGFTGVSFSRASRKFLSYVDKDKFRHRVGWFDDPIAAAKARDEAAIRIHGDFAVLNFPKDVPVPV